MTSASSSAVVRGREDLVRGEDQVPEGRLLLDDPRVVLDVGRARHAVDERGDVGRAADLVELAGPPELFLQRDQIDGVAALGELDHLVEDAAVGVAEEIVGVDDLGGEVERVVVQQDRAEDGALRFEVVRQRAFGDGGSGMGVARESECKLKTKRPEGQNRAFGRPMRTPTLTSNWLILPSATTFTFTSTVTSRCSFTGTVELAELLDRLVQLQLAAVDLEALGGQRLGDVRRRDRAEQRLGLADLARDHDLDAGHAVGERLGDLLLLGLLGLELRALALDLLLVALGREQRQLARQQVVARVAVGDLHDLAAAPEVVDVFSQNDFHVPRSSVRDVRE